jgi:hypothetical protein
MSTRAKILTSFFCIVCVATTSAQVTSKESHVDAQLQAMAASVAARQAAVPAPANSEYAIGSQVPNLAMIGFIADHYAVTYLDAKRYFFAAVATEQTKTQNSAAPNASGSTSLVQQPLAAQLLSLAVENGAVLEDVNGTTLTLSSSPYAIVASFTGDTAATYAAYGELTRFGVNASFQIIDPGNPASSVQGKQVSNAGVSLRLTKDVSSRSVIAQNKFENIYQPLQQAAAVATSALQAALFSKDPICVAAIKKYRADAQAAVAAELPSHAGETEAQVAAALKPILATAFDDDLAPVLHSLSAHPDAEVAGYLKAQQAYIEGDAAFQTAIAGLVTAPAASLIYNYQQPPNETAYHSGGITYASSLLGKNGDLTINALVSLYSKPNATANQGTLRGGSAAIQFNAIFKRSPFIKDAVDQSPISLAFSAQYQRIQENQHVAGKKADLGEGNVKLTIPLAGGLSVPVSATFANAGQSINQSFVRGNFGLTFDVDKLAALLKN